MKYTLVILAFMAIPEILQAQTATEAPCLPGDFASLTHVQGPNWVIVQKLADHSYEIVLPLGFGNYTPHAFLRTHKTDFGSTGVIHDLSFRMGKVGTTEYVGQDGFTHIAESYEECSYSPQGVSPPKEGSKPGKRDSRLQKNGGGKTGTSCVLNGDCGKGMICNDANICGTE